MIRAIYHLVPMWVWEVLLLVGMIGLFCIDGSYRFELMRRRQMKELAILAGVLSLALFGLVIGAVIGEDDDE